MVGEVDSETHPVVYKLYTHKRLDIGYNNKQVGLRINYSNIY